MRETNHNNFDINEYFARWQDGRLNSAEQKVLATWLAVESNQKAWDHLQQIWQVSSEPAIPQGTPVEAQWLHLANRLADADSKTIPAPAAILTKIFGSLALPQVRTAFAGGLAVAACVMVYLLYFSDPELQQIVVPFGKQLEIVLSDGSEVHLNAGSSFKYPDKFDSDIRRVELEGEAYFKVEPDQIPFVVETTHASTRVLGTEFNVRTWDSATEVFVNSGRVAVHSNIAVQATEVEILPGQLAVCKDGPITVQPTEKPGDLLSWRHGRLVFSNKPLSAVLDELHRTYNTKISAHQSLLQQRISAVFEQDRFQKVVEALAATLNAKVVQGKTAVSLQPR